MLRNVKSYTPAEIEEKVLALWKEKQVFQKTLIPKKGKKEKIFRFWEGPPYANGRPGIHHVLARVLKDVFLRYKTMHGYVVPRKAGWDTHGLPIEIQAEKALGITSKKQIEEMGIEKFNNKAKEEIWRFKGEFEKLTERIGYWLDLPNAYVTYYPEYVESLWWVVKQLADKKFLKEFYKVMPYCPRCQTPLSNHELGQPDVYRTVSDPSVYVTFKLAGVKNEYLLVWTTTPWTLSANVAIAVAPNVVYTKYIIDGKNVWAHRIPEELAKHVSVTATKETVKGKGLVGRAYEALYSLQKNVHLPIGPHTVLSADFVSTDDGTGLVHIAPTFGEDDFGLIFAKGMKEEYVVPHTVTDDGKMEKGIIGEGLFIKDADVVVLEDLQKRGLVMLATKSDHEYPHCWRCSSPLLYMARRSWFFEASRARNEMVKANGTVNWVPEFLKEGRFGEWIAQAKDWSISRDRYWGTPLPIWRCAECKHVSVVGSLDELNKKRFYKNKFLLVRHGEATANVEEWIASGSETGKFVSKLTTKGTKQIAKLAQELKKKKINVVYTSPYKRTHETAKAIADATGAPLVLDGRLSEINLGTFNHRQIKESVAFYEKWSPEEYFTVAPEGGESRNDVRARMYAFLREIDRKHNGETIVVVSHGDPLWMLEAACAHATREESKKLPYPKFATAKEIALDNFPTDALGMIDIHRPYADTIALACDRCGKETKRISDIADVWFDSGAMPYASVHFPFAAKNKKTAKPEAYPADFICEGIDQTRGWFYVLLATSVMLGNGAPYKNVISHGLVLDKNGQKMSKSKGNVVDPWSTIEKFGIDSIRWYFYTVNAPAEPKNFDDAQIAKVLRGLVLTMYNSFVFLNTYGKQRLDINVAPSSHNILDQWIVARINQLAGDVQKDMDAYGALGAGQKIEAFVDDLSRWYIRRSRKRLQRSENARDYAVASATLAWSLLMLAKIIAPFMPFFAEALYQSLKKAYRFNAQDSVHLEEWPIAQRVDLVLVDEMARVRAFSSAALAQRVEASIKVRQPLQKVSFKEAKLKKYNKELTPIIAEEVNVKEVVFGVVQESDVVLDTTITPELKAEGLIREVTRMIQELRQQAGYVPRDVIAVMLEVEPEVRVVLESRVAEWKKDVNAKMVGFTRGRKFDAESETKLDGYKAWAGIRKI
ncbi:MAG: class I tRNA ligase family protein [Candidatus Paceibacterota bacterium]|jgi:isoleucyl-tRNA synthetase